MHDDDTKQGLQTRLVAACPKMWTMRGGTICLCNLDTGHIGDCEDRNGNTSAVAKVMP